MSRIFISHSSRDDEAARKLKEFLETSGHRSIFLDFDPGDGIPAGRDWERELYQRIRGCQAMIVICSQASMASRWCFMEITHARALGKALLALKIDDCKLDGVLTDRQAVDLTKAGEQEAYERLLAGLVDAGLDARKLFPWDAKRPPYPGLLAFQEEDAAIFFGRRDEIGQGLELLNRLNHLGEPRVVMILGASGTGKSSLARAGLVPRLRRDPERWLVIDPFRPREDPLRELAVALSRAGCPDLSEVLRTSTSLNEVAEALRALARGSGNLAAKVLLVVDQFEELLETGEAPLFLSRLRRLTELPEAQVIVVGTMRSDFLDRFQNSGPLLGLAYEVLSLGPMSKLDIKEIIEEPAKEADLEIEPLLVEALIAEAGAPTTLPLLAFTLRELWERYADDRRLTLEEYRDRLGGVQKVVGNAADNVLKSTVVTRDQEHPLRAAFLSMMRVTDDGRYARRPAKWADLPPSIHSLLERFVAARLLVSGADGVEVAHERLFESWDLLQRWIAEDAEALNVRQQLEDAARTWNGQKRPDLLWRGARLSRVQELSADGTLLLNTEERRFVVASTRAGKFRRWGVIGAVAAFAIVATVFAVFAFRSAEQERRSAIRTEERARMAEVEQLTSRSAQNFAEHERVRARLQVESIDPDEKQALLAIAPKYLAQSKRYQQEARRSHEALEIWRLENALVEPKPDALFTLEALRAGGGNAFLIHYGNPVTPRRVLVDGGSKKTYRDVLKPRLESLRSISGEVSLSLVVSSQTDQSHLEGLVQLVEGLQPQGSVNHSFSIAALWSNAFVPGPADMATELVRFMRKGRLVAGAQAAGIPVNTPFTRMVAAPEAGAARVSMDQGLTVTVLSPRVQWLRRFADFWLQRWRSQAERQGADPRLLAALHEFDILETFADPRIELLPSPIEIVDPSNVAGRESSVVNLASMVLMFELNGKRMLLPSDARSDVILSALAQAGYTDENGNMEVDMLVLPHGGSDQNVSLELFRRLKAKYYVISYDGTFKLPRVRTFEMLFDARREDSSPYSIVLTYTPEEYLAAHNREPYPVAELCALLTREWENGRSFEVLTPNEGQSSIGIDLWSAAAFVDKGARNAICGR